jgi:hypothetical protein
VGEGNCTATSWVSTYRHSPKHCEVFSSHFIFTKPIHTPSISSEMGTKPMLMYSRRGSAYCLYSSSVGFQESKLFFLSDQILLPCSPTFEYFCCGYCTKVDLTSTTPPATTTLTMTEIHSLRITFYQINICLLTLLLTTDAITFLSEVFVIRAIKNEMQTLSAGGIESTETLFASGLSTPTRPG